MGTRGISGGNPCQDAGLRQVAGSRVFPPYVPFVAPSGCFPVSFREAQGTRNTSGGNMRDFRREPAKVPGEPKGCRGHTRTQVYVMETRYLGKPAENSPEHAGLQAGARGNTWGSRRELGKNSPKCGNSRELVDTRELTRGNQRVLRRGIAGFIATFPWNPREIAGLNAGNHGTPFDSPVPPTGAHAIPYLPMGYRRSYVGSCDFLRNPQPTLIPLI